MTITKRQFSHLSEMGIDVWQQRNTSKPPETSETDNISTLPIDPNTLTQHVMFTDILQCLGLSIGEIIIENNIMNLGLFNWQFTKTNTISFAHNTLSTPDINTFITRKNLKKYLWITIQQEILTQ